MTTPPPGPRRGALALLASTQLLLIMDTAIVNVALPSVGEDLGSAAHAPNWVAQANQLSDRGFQQQVTPRGPSP
ncbi:hypothetical protein ACFU8I_16045, partial [Streptomyces sp. NPDC057540]